MDRERIDNGQDEFGNLGSGSAGLKLQLVHAGSSQFGILADDISAVVVWREPTPLPHAPSSVLGVVSIQGRMLTVLDLATLTSNDPALSEGSRKVPSHFIALRGDEQLALAVEMLGEVISLPADDLLAQQAAETTAVLASIQYEGARLQILNVEGLFPAALSGRQRRQRSF